MQKSIKEALKIFNLFHQNDCISLNVNIWQTSSSVVKSNESFLHFLHTNIIGKGTVDEINNS